MSLSEKAAPTSEDHTIAERWSSAAKAFLRTFSRLLKLPIVLKMKTGADIVARLSFAAGEG